MRSKTAFLTERSSITRLAVAVVVFLTAGFLSVVGGLGSTNSAKAATSSQCNFSISSGPGSVLSVAGTQIITGVVGGSTVVYIDCNTSSGAAAAVQASLLAAVGTTAVSQINEAGPPLAKPLATHDALCPDTTACTGFDLALPATFVATKDTNAQCPPTQAQIDRGLFGCAIAVINSKLAPVAETLDLYASETAPALPTLALVAPSSGLTVTLGDAAGSTSYWAADAIQTVQAVVNGTTPTPAPSTCGSGGGYGYTAANFIKAELQPVGGGSVISLSAANVQITNDCYDNTTLYAPQMGGSLTLPSGLASGNYNVFVCEQDLGSSVFPSNDSSKVCAGDTSGTGYEVASAEVSVLANGTLSTTSSVAPSTTAPLTTSSSTTLGPTSNSSTTAPIVTNSLGASTGEPFFGETLLSIALLALGGLLVFGLKRGRKN
ncbi:MAG: hypothetical protein HKL80_01700 [Acidimicrobiales bacterium]|nr:hypothetical protein [Acidimicrobiales bacterium]